MVIYAGSTFINIMLVFRIIITAILLGLILIPSGKLFEIKGNVYIYIYINNIVR